MDAIFLKFLFEFELKYKKKRITFELRKILIKLNQYGNCR